LKSLNFIHCKSRYHEPLIHNTLISPRKIAARLKEIKEALPAVIFFAVGFSLVELT
jgi:hypothetical protein